MLGAGVLNDDNLEQMVYRCLEKLLPTYLKSIKESEDQIFDLPEAAKYLNLKPSTIRVMKCQKKIPSLNRGRKLAFSQKQLDEWNSNGRPALEDNGLALKLDTQVAKAVKKIKARKN